jgi:hypothetical protein
MAAVTSPGEVAGRGVAGRGVAGGGEVVGDPSWLLRAAAAVAVRPRLWGTAVRQLGALAAPGWWRTRPRLPLPAPGYLRFRMVTAYGDPDARPDVDDVVSYLSWCRDEHRRARSAPRRRHGRPVAPRAGR